jgi:preprotein translocase subunit SecG
MAVVVNILIIIASILLILIVLVQDSKSGGLASNFSSSNQVMGVRRTTDFLEKATWTLAISLLVFCLSTTLTIDRGVKVQSKSAIEEQLADQPKVPSSLPTAPVKK